MAKPLYGLTHKEDGSAIVRQVTTTKVGIGLPQGKDLHVYIDGSGKWVVKVGKDKIERFEDRKEARKFYLEAAKTAPDRKFPGKIQYFSFTRISADGNYQPDWDMIEQHGPLPVEIPIIFFRNEPLDAEYAYFTSLEKKCSGDGKDATRIVTLFTDKDQEAAANRAKEAGERYYKIEDGCWTMGCPFAKPYSEGDKHFASPCKPHGRLFFQFLKSPTLGATAYFDTTGRRSISQLFSCLQDFREFTGRGDADKGYVAGIPLWLTVRPYRATFMQGTVKKTSTQYGVGIEFRGEGIEPARLVESLISASEEYRERTAQRQLTAGPIAVSLDGEREEREPVEITAEEFTEIEEEQEVFIPEIPEALTAEFYPEGPEPDNDEPPVEMDAEPERKTPQRKKKDEPPAETVAPDKWEKARVHIGEMIDAMAMKQYKGNIYDLVFEESGARKLKDIPVDKLVIVEARLFGELKKL
jgi:hypothetical protein